MLGQPPAWHPGLKFPGKMGPHQNWKIDGVEKLRVVQGIAQPDGTDCSVHPPVQATQVAYRRGFVILARDVVKAIAPNAAIATSEATASLQLPSLRS